MKVLLAPTLDLAKNINADITVEAEYGDYCVEGSLYTAAHHGSRSANPAPCSDKNIPVMPEATVLVSHIDLDTLGGIARILGHSTVYYEFFWELAAYVDINGPHRMMQSSDANPKNVARMYAWWAWSQANRGPRRDNSMIHDVTDEIIASLEALAKILAGDEEMIKAGRELAAAEAKLDTDSLCVEDNIGEIGFTMRHSDQFVNHLYGSGLIVVAYNTRHKSITLSFAEDIEGLNAAEIMKAVFGPAAGGHRNIAGTPRGVEFDSADMEKVINEIRKQYIK